MRQAINENPVVQIGLIAGLLLVMVVLFMTRMGGGPEPAGDSDAASAVAVPGGSTPAGDVAVAPAPGTPAAPAAGAAPATPGVPGATVSPEALQAGPGMPEPVAAAWKDGKAIVLLIVKPSATDDKLIRDATRQLSGRGGVALFIVEADKVARYSRVAQGAGVTRVPALVVVRPKRISKTPQAMVSYGFRDSASVVQAVDDALYSGPENIPYHPR